MAPTVRVCVDAARTAHVTTSLASVCASLAARGATVIEVGDIIHRGSRSTGMVHRIRRSIFIQVSENLGLNISKSCMWSSAVEFNALLYHHKDNYNTYKCHDVSRHFAKFQLFIFENPHH